MKTFKNDLNIYIKTISVLDNNFDEIPITDRNSEHLLFNLNKDILFCGSIHGEQILYCKTIRFLNLLVLSEDPKSNLLNQIKEQIKNNGAIDGIIYKSRFLLEKYNIHYFNIYLKNLKNSIENIGIINDGKCDPNKIDDISVITKYYHNSFYVNQELIILDF